MCTMLYWKWSTSIFMIMWSIPKDPRSLKLVSKKCAYMAPLKTRCVSILLSTYLQQVRELLCVTVPTSRLDIFAITCAKLSLGNTAIVTFLIAVMVTYNRSLFSCTTHCLRHSKKYNLSIRHTATPILHVISMAGSCTQCVIISQT